MTDNSHILRVIGEAEMPESLEFGREYKLELIGSLSHIKKKDNDDGSYSFINAFRLITCSLIDEKGKKTKLKDKTKSSVKMRRAIETIRVGFCPEKDSEEFYQRVMPQMTDLENLEPYLKKLNLI